MFEALPEDRLSRWSLARDFARGWRNLHPDPSVTESLLAKIGERTGIRLPPAVREWHLLLAELGDLWSGQDSLWFPLQPFADGLLVPVMVENQNCFRMGILLTDLGLDDPPVYRYSDGQVDHLLSPSVSEFALQMLVLETVWSGRYSYFACVDSIDPNGAAAIEARFQRCALNDLYLWSVPIRFLTGRDVVLRLDYEGGFDGYAYVGFAASTVEAFRETVDFLSGLGIGVEVS